MSAGNENKVPFFNVSKNWHSATICQYFCSFNSYFKSLQIYLFGFCRLRSHFRSRKNHPVFFLQIFKTFLEPVTDCLAWNSQCWGLFIRSTRAGRVSMGPSIDNVWPTSLTVTSKCFGGCDSCPDVALDKYFIVILRTNSEPGSEHTCNDDVGCIQISGCNEHLVFYSKQDFHARRKLNFLI